MLRKLFFLLLFLVVIGTVGAGAVAVWGYYYFSRDLPKFSRITDYQPAAVSSVFARDGRVIAEFYEQRRYVLKIDEVPKYIVNAFLAAEDASFYSHPGIDIISIVRAAIKNFETGSVKQGASTITQQVIKNIWLNRERKYERKIKEAILAYRLEQQLTKDQILELYLNQIFFGNNAYGLKSAARLYFHKEVAELTLAEAALLAGLPKAPSFYSPLRNPDKAKDRQRYVLRQMVRAGFVSSREAQQARREQLEFHRAKMRNIFHAPYYVTEVRRQFKERWKDLNLDTDGLQIHTALDIDAYKFGEAALQKGLRSVDKRRGWRGAHRRGPLTVEHYKDEFGKFLKDELVVGEIYPALVTAKSVATRQLTVQVGDIEGVVDLNESKWARRIYLGEDQFEGIRPELMIKIGDVVEVSVTEDAEGLAYILDQTPAIQGALTLIDPHSGEVNAIVGGYSYQLSEFNRATQGRRQPGSAFKPVVYLAAINEYNYTPSTLVHDEYRTFRIGDDYWTPANYDKNFLGSITLRMALEKSRNLVSADIISRIGVDAAIRYARLLGIESRLGRNLSLSLGSSEVSVLELTRAYGVFAAKGLFMPSTFITKIVDRFGNEIYNYEEEKLLQAREVISEDVAFVLAHLMQGVVQRGTGRRIQALKRPVAGKTGTSNEQMDAWFIGYTPEWVCGVWTGFDEKETIGPKETGGRVAGPIFLEFMDDFLTHRDELMYSRLEGEAQREAEQLGVPYVPPEKLKPLGFSVPEGVDPYLVNHRTGRLTDSSDSSAILEYFIKGTEPHSGASKSQEAGYLEDPYL